MRPLSRRAFTQLALLPAGAAVASCRRRSSTLASRADSAATVEVDASRSIGAFDRLSGVHGSPAPIVDGEPDLTPGFREARIAASRFPQDCYPNTLTLAGIFPDENADPEARASYHFEAIDRHVRAARSAGAEILWQTSYDVGRSDRWVGPNLGGRAPEDLERWSRVVTRCLEHFNHGFAGGFDHAVRNVEFVNEPDGLGGFNSGHEKRLLPAFLRFLDTIEAHNRAHPDAAVRAVGPGIPLSLAEWPEWRPRFDAALSAITSAGKSLPVFSFHTYGRDVSPRGNIRLAKDLRALLDAHRLQATELWNTEWLAGDFLRQHLALDKQKVARATDQDQRRYGSAMAAYAVACKLGWQGVVRGSYYYRANLRAFPPGYEPPLAAGGRGYGRFFAADGRLNALGLHERLLAEVAALTPERCATSLPEGDTLFALGLRSPDATRASLVVASLAREPRSVNLRVHGIGSPNVRIRRSVLDETMDSTPRDLGVSAQRSGVHGVTFDLAPLSAAWLLLGP
ncbi:MAG: hypothetical protein IT377_33335 [Polyangiaceae bacterium]|nr:hypothetical protein [Polyangiaceae bacterium]